MHNSHAFSDQSHSVECRLELRPDEAVSVPSVIGTAVLCLKGPLWLTQEGEWRDFILVEGTRFVSGGTGKIVISALDTAGQALVLVPLPGAAWGLAPGLHVGSEAIERVAQKARNARNAEIWRLLLLLYSGLTAARRWVTREPSTRISHKFGKSSIKPG